MSLRNAQLREFSLGSEVPTTVESVDHLVADWLKFCSDFPAVPSHPFIDSLHLRAFFELSADHEVKAQQRCEDYRDSSQNVLLPPDQQEAQNHADDDQHQKHTTRKQRGVFFDSRFLLDHLHNLPDRRVGDELLVWIRGPHVPLFVEFVRFSVPVKFVDQGIVGHVCWLDKLLFVVNNVAFVEVLGTVALGPGAVLDSHFGVHDTVVVGIIPVS